MNLDFQEADRLLHWGGNFNNKRRSRRKMANNTYLYRTHNYCPYTNKDDVVYVECIALRLHGTDVLTFWPDGSVEFCANGWRTMTTKDRMNYVARLFVFSASHKHRASKHWWVGHRDWEQRRLVKSQWGDWQRAHLPVKRWVPFFDGLRMDQETGRILNDQREIDGHLIDREPPPPERTWNQKIGEYLNYVTLPRVLQKVGKEGSNRPERPEHYTDVVSGGFLDLSLVSEAVNLVAARQGDWDIKPGLVALDWARDMERGRVPPRFRSTMRRYLNYQDPYERIPA